MKNSIMITGGNAGIGKAAAITFAKAGYNIAIASRRDEENQRVKAEIESLDAECLTFALDVTDRTAVQKAVTDIVEKFGGLHCALNNAGVEQVPTPLPEQTDDDYEKIMGVNVRGVWLSMQAQIPAIIKSGGGSIVNTASVAGHIGMAQIPLYIAAKHAVIGLTKSVALEYATQGVRINAVSPGAVHTDLYDRFTQKDPEMEKAIEGMHPMGRSGSPEEVASGVLYLCRDATWTTGQSLVLDGGFTAQ